MAFYSNDVTQFHVSSQQQLDSTRTENVILTQKVEMLSKILAQHKLKYDQIQSEWLYKYNKKINEYNAKIKLLQIEIQNKHLTLDRMKKEINNLKQQSISSDIQHKAEIKALKQKLYQQAHTQKRLKRNDINKNEEIEALQIDILEKETTIAVLEKRLSTEFEQYSKYKPYLAPELTINITSGVSIDEDENIGGVVSNVEYYHRSTKTKLPQIDKNNLTKPPPINVNMDQYDMGTHRETDMDTFYDFIMMNDYHDENNDHGDDEYDFDNEHEIVSKTDNNYLIPLPDHYATLRDYPSNTPVIYDREYRETVDFSFFDQSEETQCAPLTLKNSASTAQLTVIVTSATIDEDKDIDDALNVEYHPHKTSLMESTTPRSINVNMDENVDKADDFVIMQAYDFYDGDPDKTLNKTESDHFPVYDYYANLRNEHSNTPIIYDRNYRGETETETNFVDEIHCTPLALKERVTVTRIDQKRQTYIDRANYVNKNTTFDRNKSFKKLKELLETFNKNNISSSSSPPIKQAEIERMIDFARMSIGRYYNWLTIENIKYFAVMTDFNLFLFNDKYIPSTLNDIVNKNYLSISIASIENVQQRFDNNSKSKLYLDVSIGSKTCHTLIFECESDDECRKWIEEIQYQTQIVSDLSLACSDSINWKCVDNKRSIWIPSAKSFNV